jgi:hypothetical protein
VGVSAVTFNLYVLSLGVRTDVLGAIKEAAPLAEALEAIPVGLVAQMLGYREFMLLVALVAGATQLARVASSSVSVIAAASFAGGPATSGNFVVRLPFLAAHSGDHNRNLVFSLNTMISSVAMALGAVFAGHAPSLMHRGRLT